MRMTRKSERQETNERRWIAAATRLAALALVVLGVMAVVPESQARLYPYYVIRNASKDVAVKPRILFVMDTSGSMSLSAQSGSTQCNWDACEDDANAGTVNESRIMAARRAINNVVASTADQATFSLMTFGQAVPHGPTAVPTACAGGRRFEWIDQFGYSAWETITRYADHDGAWRLCQGNNIRPWPYLRWDALGEGSVISANNQDPATVPASPLLAVSNIPDWQNAYRSVQWFDRYVGTVFNPNATTDPDRSITYASVGDYGNDDTTKDANVWGNDFYYWPYVDGFPGYSQFGTLPDYDGRDRAGVMDGGSAEGYLYVPFYIDDIGSVIADPDLHGPTDAQDAIDQILAKTEKMIYGGVDAGGSTPWADTVGDDTATPTQTNAQFGHQTVAEYLSFVTSVNASSECVPTSAVLITDGEPSGGQGGSTLYGRLSDLRTELGVETYVVGFFLAGSAELNDMACAAAGACTGGCTDPCTNTPTDDWDTCAEPTDPTNECAWQANSSDELQQVLTDIINEAADLDIPSGPAATVNTFNGDPGEDDILQTHFESHTEYPSWQGHLRREACDDRDEFDDLEEYCEVPVPPIDPAELEEPFGPCAQDVVWDAGECLRLTDWTDRRIYAHDDANNIFLVANADGTASAQFQALLNGMGLLDAGDPDAHADAITAYLLGRDAPDAHKLPGLAGSSPIVVRRMPPYRPEFTPSVAINDPHCGGRFIGAAGSIPDSLEDYAQAANDVANQLATPSAHFEQQEAVVLADDMGVIHAFQLNSGNELFGLVPRFALESLVAQADIGAATYGQQGEIEDHNYGVSATLNHGWVYDDRDADPANHTWRHYGIIGMGIGGQEWIALDLSHMSPSSPSGPVDILWTSEDPLLKPDYDNYNGETWARPSIIYHVDADVATNEPDAFVVMGSGYPEDGTPPTEQGRTLVRADALTGTIIESVQLPDITHPVFEPSFGSVVDTAVSTHCLSRYWAEAQEAYVADPAGRLFRWDLGRAAAHESDSGGTWTTEAIAVANTPFRACTGATTCTVDPSGEGDPFLFPPAVSANDRIDDFTSGSVDALTETDQFLVALVSGSAADDSLTGAATFHSSLYVLVDDHSGADKTVGFSIPAGGPISLPGADPNYMRVPISSIERTRTFVPYTGATEITNTRTFAPDTRPIRAPRIYVTGAVDPDSIGPGLSPVIQDGVEVHYIEFTVYEPPSSECDTDWYDASSGEWHADPGQTYVIRFRVTNAAGTPFNLGTGGGASDLAGIDFGTGFGDTGLVLDTVEQLGGTDCPSGDCGTSATAPSSPPCDNNTIIDPVLTTPFSLTVYQSELSGFTPIE